MKLTEKRKKVVEHAQAYGSVKSRDVAKMFHVGNYDQRRWASSYLSKMCRAGHLERTGCGEYVPAQPGEANKALQIMKSTFEKKLPALHLTDYQRAMIVGFMDDLVDNIEKTFKLS